MSVTRTFTVTVVSTDSGNKYFIDGVQQATLNLGESGTYKFDQSDSSNGNHPLRFSTTSNGTWAGGSQYTTGVTTNGVPGQAGAYTQIVVAASAPTLYYYCTNHSGMGGQANTVDGNSWGIFPWSLNQYGDQDSVDFTLTGLSTTSSVGVVEAFNEVGWGRQLYGNSGWGVDYAVLPTGLQATSAVGSVIALDIQTVIPTGVQAATGLGSLTTVQLTTVIPTGLQTQSELGTFDNAGTLVGWGRNGWGEEPYGDSFNSLVQLNGLSSTASAGAITPADVMGVTGVQATSAVGAPTLNLTSVVIPTGVSVTSNVGSTSITQASVGLTGFGMTSAVGGIILDALVVDVNGLSTTSSVGSVSQQTSQVLTGVQATSAVGTLVPEIGVPLTGLSTTSAVGTPTLIFSISLTLTGQQLTSSVGELIILGFKDVNIVGNTNYSDVDVVGETSYTDVTHVA